jgi:hypothetical protein
MARMASRFGGIRISHHDKIFFKSLITIFNKCSMHKKRRKSYFQTQFILVKALYIQVHIFGLNLFWLKLYTFVYALDIINKYFFFNLFLMHIVFVYAVDIINKHACASKA